MACKYNTHLIKLRKSYSIKEISLLFKVDRKTCSRWIKSQKLKVMESGVSPVLVLGSDLKKFIQEQRNTRKVNLTEAEYYCLKCKRAVVATKESEQVVETGKRIGKNERKQMVKIGLCEVCGRRINRFIKLYQKD